MISELAIAVLLSCDPALAALFTPARPPVGRYEVCTTEGSLESTMSDGALEGVHYGSVEPANALDAFGTAGPYDRSALARVYGGQRPRVAHGWLEQGDRLTSILLVSPYPDRTLTRLMSGTMVVRYVLIIRSSP